jgi:asparagine synthase (glutamine-hydrolysing)
MRQAPDRKIRDGTGKWLLRRLVRELLPTGVRLAPKRPLQTPQREWLRGELAPWTQELVEDVIKWGAGSWFNADNMRREINRYMQGAYDSSFFVWQWIGVGLWLRAEQRVHKTGAAA